jgi:hypothetical protein
MERLDTTCVHCIHVFDLNNLKSEFFEFKRVLLYAYLTRIIQRPLSAVATVEGLNSPRVKNPSSAL